MNRSERLAALMLALQSQGTKRQSAATIAQNFGVSRRTILRDMAALGRMGVPVESIDGAAGGYRLSADAVIAPLPLTLRETTLLLLALDGLARHTESPFRTERDSLHEKLLTMLTPQQRAVAQGYLKTLSIDVPARPVQSAPHLDTLAVAARESRWLAVRYRSTRGLSDQAILPRRLYASGGLWYVEAFSATRGEERQFRADRFEIVTWCEAPAGIHVPSPAPYARPEHPEVRVTLSAAGVERAERDPHLADAIMRQSDGSGSLAFRCPPTELDWYARWFISFGEDACVLAPEELRARIAALARKIAARYDER